MLTNCLTAGENWCGKANPEEAREERNSVAAAICPPPMWSTSLRRLGARKNKTRPFMKAEKVLCSATWPILHTEPGKYYSAILATDILPIVKKPKDSGQENMKKAGSQKSN